MEDYIQEFIVSWMKSAISTGDKPTVEKLFNFLKQEKLLRFLNAKDILDCAQDYNNTSIVDYLGARFTPSEKPKANDIPLAKVGLSVNSSNITHNSTQEIFGKRPNENTVSAAEQNKNKFFELYDEKLENDQKTWWGSFAQGNANKNMSWEEIVQHSQKGGHRSKFILDKMEKEGLLVKEADTSSEKTDNKPAV